MGSEAKRIVCFKVEAAMTIIDHFGPVIAVWVATIIAVHDRAFKIRAGMTSFFGICCHIILVIDKPFLIK
jgi:hypothetical protein